MTRTQRADRRRAERLRRRRRRTTLAAAALLAVGTALGAVVALSPSPPTQPVGAGEPSGQAATTAASTTVGGVAPQIATAVTLPDDHAFTAPPRSPDTGRDAVRTPLPTTASATAPQGTGTTMAAPATTAGTTAAIAPATAGSSAAAQADAEVVVLVNQQRAAAGCQPLRVDARLTAAATAHSEDMAVRGYFDHNTPDGVTPWTRMIDAGYPLGAGGENIAAGQQTPQAVMTAWMNSPGHRANILNCGFTDIGVGVYYGGAMSPYWTQDFGTPAG